MGIRGPLEPLPLEPSPRYVFIAGGIGVTPILPMVEQAERGGAEWTLHVWRSYGASMAFVDELAAYGDKVADLAPGRRTDYIDLDGLLRHPRGRHPGLRVWSGALARRRRGAMRELAVWGAAPGAFTAKDVGAPVLDEPFEVELARSGRVLTVPTDRAVVEVLDEAGVRS